MDLALARQYHKRLAEMLSELQLAQTPEQRQPIILRMQNLLAPMHVVHTGATQHIEESLRKLKYPQTAIVNAALYTIERSLQRLHETIASHPEPHFVLHAEPKLYARPVEEEELRSLVEKGRLFEETHVPYLHAIVAEPHVEDVLLNAKAELLQPVFERLGFPEPRAIVFFRTAAVPRLAYPTERMPSLRLARFRGGIPVSVLHHRVL